MDEPSIYNTPQIKPIDRLFLRIASLYGRHWIDMWAGVPMDAVKDEWQQKLNGMSSKVVFKAVDHCALHLKFPPTLPEFIQICKANIPLEASKALPRHFTDEEITNNRKRLQEIFSQLKIRTSQNLSNLTEKGMKNADS